MNEFDQESLAGSVMLRSTMSLLSISHSGSRQSTPSVSNTASAIGSNNNIERSNVENNSEGVNEDMELYPALEPEAVPVIMKRIIHPLSMENMMNSTPLRIIEGKPRTNFWIST